MIARIKIPRPSANIGEVAVTRLFKSENDPIAKGEPLAELTTDKAVFELEAPVSGTVRKMLADEKSVLPVGFILALVGSPDEPLPDAEAWNRKVLAKHRGEPLGARQTKRDGDAKPSSSRTGGAERAVRATPAARRLAREKGLDLKIVARALGRERINEKAVADYLANNAR